MGRSIISLAFTFINGIERVWRHVKCLDWCLDICFPTIKLMCYSRVALVANFRLVCKLVNVNYVEILCMLDYFVLNYECERVSQCVTRGFISVSFVLVYNYNLPSVTLGQNKTYV